MNCPKCGGTLPSAALGGLCPRCLAAVFNEEASGQFPSGVEPVDAQAEDSPDQNPQPLPPGKGQFMVEREIARGGMGVVYEARDASIGRTVVVKFLRPEREMDRGVVDRFLAEARITGQLEHPAIVPVYHLGLAADGRPFYAMRQIQGETLAAVLARLRDEDAGAVAQYSLGALLNIFQKICDAVAYAHSRGVIHRDLKPDNVMIGPFGEVIVMDWGLAKTSAVGHEEASTVTRDATPDLTGTLDHTIMGTLGFMAPEQAEGQSNRADERTDVYALGAILYAILTLRAPIRGKDAEVMLDRTRSGDIRPPSEYNPGASRVTRPIPLPHCPNRKIPNVLSAVTMKALATDPAERYQQVAELQRDIAAYQGGFATSAEQAGWLKQMALFIRRHKTITSAALIVLLLTIGFMAKIIASERKARATLANLRSTAPTYYEAALALLDEQNLDAALEKASFAVSVAPDEAKYHQLRGNILQTQQQLGQAAQAFARANTLQARLPFLKQNLELCAVLSKQMSNGVLPRSAMWDLYAALMKQGRGAEALFLSNLLKQDRQQLVNACKATLESAGIPVEGRVTFNESDLNLDLEKVPIRDLTPLRGLPFTFLRISATQVEDLSPLKGMPLRSIWMHGLPRVHDLAPLRSRELREIQMGFTRVSDLSPLKDLRLTGLVANNNPIADLSPLRGLPLEDLSIGSSLVSDLSPLTEMISLKKLNISYSQVTNLTPLAGLLLHQLHAESTRISDLSPLQGMPLKELYLHDCRRVKDISPITNCFLLERITLPTVATNIAVLRKLPALQFIYFTPPKDRWTNNAAEFWKAYDARAVSRK